MEMEVPGGRGRGRPKQRWMDNVREDMRNKQLSEDEVHDRAGWRRTVRNIDPHIEVGLRCRERRRLTFVLFTLPNLEVILLSPSSFSKPCDKASEYGCNPLVPQTLG